jgi:hypothetical protein
MAKPTTELAKWCKPPPYMHWDQRGKKPVLLSDLKLIDSDRKCKRLSFQTDDPEIAKRYMRLLVPSLVANGRLSPDCGAAKVYGSNGGRSRLEKLETELHRLKTLSKAEYGPEALAAAKRWRCPVGIIHHLTGRKPALSPGTLNTRRMRARQRGQRIAMANLWYHRPPRGKGFYKNGRVMTARIQLGRRATTWSLKFRDDVERAAATMNPVLVAWHQTYEAAKKELNWEIGTAEHTVAVAARVEACGRLGTAIHQAGGPKELVAFVTSQEEVGRAVPRRPPAVTAAPSAILSATRMRQAAAKQCKQLLIERYEAYLKGGRKEWPLKDELRAEMMGRIEKLSARAFDRCWKATVVVRGWDWKEPGVRGK